jgi:phosphatidylethanolamine-binding protein (PEBP) family uncharacterized protein
MLALVLASCGSTSSPTAPEKPAIRFNSPALVGKGLIPARYKCNVRQNWLPLRWGALPASTRELVLYMVRFGAPKATTGGKVKAEIQAEGIIVGLKPGLHRLPAGKLPRGAVVGVRPISNRAATICPSTGTAQNLLFRLYALPRKLELGKGSQPSTLVSRLSAQSLAAGTFIARYGVSPKAIHGSP